MASSNCWALVPVKRLAQAKARLAPALTPRERQALAVAMLERVLVALQRTPQLRGWLVVSADEEALRTAEKHGGTALLETGEGLNEALTQAAMWANHRGADSVLALPADVPLVEPSDISAILGLAREERAVVLAPARRDGGTNALLVKPPLAIPFCFGPGSAETHQAAAKERGIPIHIYTSSRLALDIDTIQDVAELNGFLPKIRLLPSDRSLAPDA